MLQYPMNLGNTEPEIQRVCTNLPKLLILKRFSVQRQVAHSFKAIGTQKKINHVYHFQKHPMKHSQNYPPKCKENPCDSNIATPYIAWWITGFLLLHLALRPLEDTEERLRLSGQVCQVSPSLRPTLPEDSEPQDLSPQLPSLSR